MTRSPWKFFRAGGFDQVRLDSGADLLRLDQLDLKLWVALACPTTGIEFSAETAALIDTDRDGRIRAPELIAAVRWAGARLTDAEELVKGGDSLAIAAIADESLRATAREICAGHARPEATAVTLADVSDAGQLFAATRLNGDGVVVPESAEDEATRRVIGEIGDCMGTVPDRSGKPGVDQAKADAFFAECAAYDQWIRKSEDGAAEILPAGEATGAAAAAVRATRTKVDDYFGRCRLAAFDPRASALLLRREEDYLAVAAQDLSLTASEIAPFPLAQAAPGKPLPLEVGVNPAHADAITLLRSDAIRPLLGDRRELSEADWLTLRAKLAAFEGWAATKAGAAVERLGRARIRELAAGGAREAVTAVIARDRALESRAAAIADVRKLLLLRRDLHLLCTNFVNFRDFYDAGEPATFQAGTLYLDQRSCTLTLAVEDPARHAAMAGLAGSYLAYCDCVRRGTGERRQIVAAFTNGDADNLMVGRNGLFLDRSGRDWDATIIKIIENPISIRQAFWSPYKKLVRMIEEQVAKRAAIADAAALDRLGSTAKDVAHMDVPKPEPRRIDVGAVAALGVAFGALATAFAAIAGYLSGLLKLPFWQVCMAVAGLLFVISGPPMLIAWLKLRRRNLGPILDANGWALNARARLNVPFGESLTGVARLPAGASISSRDRFGEKASPWPRLAVVVIVAGFFWSLLNQYYVLDALFHRLTGRHYPALFARAPADGGGAPERPGDAR